MPKIKPSSLQELKNRVDIEAVAARYTTLKKAGSGRLKGTCPFPGHTEKTPSFFVTPGRNFCKCFGCGKGGDQIDLIRHITSLDFNEAAELLAKDFSVELEYENGPSREERSERTQVYEIHNIAATYFRNCAHSTTDANARFLRRYFIKDRGFSKETSDAYLIGFAPTDDNYALWNKLAEKFSPVVLERSGLFFCKKGARGEIIGRGRLRWSGRLMIPVRDANARICAFVGRTVPGIKDETSLNESKYVNSPETPIFSKGDVLFNYDRARTLVPEGGRMILVEGQLDTMRMDSVGFKWTVAPQGTAITLHQVQMAGRFEAGMDVFLDGDEAGRKAAVRTVALALEAGVDTRFIPIDSKAKEDPDQLFKGMTPEQAQAKYAEMAKGALSPMQAAYRAFFPKPEDATAEAKGAAAKQILEMLCKVPSKVAAYAHIEELANIMDIPAEAVWADYSKACKLPPPPPRPAAEPVAQEYTGYGEDGRQAAPIEEVAALAAVA